MKKFTLIGSPINHSLSPRIHQQFAEQTVIALCYDLTEAATEVEFAAAVKELIAKGYSGANVTSPCKAMAFAIADKLSARAMAAGAVNTLVFGVESLYGDYTDGVGLVRDLERQQVQLAGARVLMIGAGAVVTGLVQALCTAGVADLQLWARNVDRLQKAVLDLNLLHVSAYTHDSTEVSCYVIPSEARDLQNCRGIPRFSRDDVTSQLHDDEKCAHVNANGNVFDLVINASSAGLSGELTQLPPGLVIGKETACYDLSYGVAAEKFVALGKASGARISCSGVGMLIEQAAEGFALWHGVNPDTVLLHAASQ